MMDILTPTEWDARLLATGTAHPFQSSSFARAMALRGHRPIYLMSDQDPDWWSCLVLVGGDGRVRWFYGPVLHSTGGDGTSALDQLLRAMKQRGLGRVQYATTAVDYGHQRPQPSHRALSGVEETPFVRLQDLPMDPMSRMHRSVRKNVGRCERAGVTITFSDDADSVERYVTMLRANRMRLGLQMPAFFPDAEVIRAFSGPMSRMEVAIASVKGVDIAGLGFATFGPIVAEIGVARSEDYDNLRLPAHDLIKVAAIRTFVARGLGVYDLMGVRRTPTDDKERGIRHFKLKFAPDLAPYGVIEQHRPKVLTFVARFLRATRP